MLAREALESLRLVLSENPTVNVLVAAKPKADLLVQRLNLSQELAGEFLSAARLAEPDSDVILKPYEPGYTPDWNEITFVELARHPAMTEVIREVSQVQEPELFREQGEVIDHLRFYAIVVSASARRQAVFFRTYSPKKELTRRAGFAALLSHGQYDKVDTKMFLFDRRVDCFSWDGYLFVHNVPAFQRIFNYLDELRAKADETVGTILKHIPISNADAFRMAGLGQVQMMSKLAQIARKPYLEKVTIRDIRRTIEEFGLDVQIVREDGREKLRFETSPGKRWLLLKLLDDDFLGSIMTDQKYEANSKSAISQ